MKKRDLLFLLIVIAAIIVVYFYLDVERSYFDVVIDPVVPVNFGEVHPRNIVKNYIPIILLEQNNSSCKVYGEKFSSIVNHDYFVRSQELVDKLQYNPDEKTLIVPCDKLFGEKTKLVVWYVVEESEIHPTKYIYTFEPWPESDSP